MPQRRVAAAGDDPATSAGDLRRAGASVLEMREVSQDETMRVRADAVRNARILDHADEAFPAGIEAPAGAFSG